MDRFPVQGMKLGSGGGSASVIDQFEDKLPDTVIATLGRAHDSARQLLQRLEELETKVNGPVPKAVGEHLSAASSFSLFNIACDIETVLGTASRSLQAIESRLG